MDVKIGDKLWLINPNYYASHGRLQKWREVTVKSETSRSWVVGIPQHDWADVKISKKTLEGLFDEEKMALREYEDKWKSRAYRIGAAVGGNRNAILLHGIANQLGMTEEDFK